MLDGVQGVFVQKDRGFDFVHVEVGQDSGGLVEVKRGLKVGDRVATEGVFDLKNAIMKASIQGE